MSIQEFLIPLLAAAIIAGTPILFAALGELITERAGIINLGVEGIMLMGACLDLWRRYPLETLGLAFWQRCWQVEHWRWFMLF